MANIVLGKISKMHSVLLDGFPRTVNQATLLPKNYIDTVIALDIPDAVIIDRIKNRWVHSKSGRTYSYDYSPPKVPAYDDITGDPLTKRNDDRMEIMQKRLETYHQMAGPLLEYYSNEKKLQLFHGSESGIIYPQIKFYLQETFGK